jgi:L-2-hydroxyglutarate oxidase LhgO
MTFFLLQKDRIREAEKIYRKAERNANKEQWKHAEGIMRAQGIKPNRSSAERIGATIPANVKKIGE